MLFDVFPKVIRALDMTVDDELMII